MKKYQKLVYITYEGVEITIYINKKNCFIEEEQIVLLYNLSNNHIKNILERIIIKYGFEQYLNNFNSDGKKLLYNIKITEEIDRELKCNNGSQLITYVKNFLKPSSVDIVEIGVMLLEVISNL